MKKLLVTGGTGFIGSHTCLRLLEVGYEVVIVDSLINSEKKIIDKILKILSTNKSKNDLSKKLKFINCDLRDENLISKVFQEESKKSSPIEAVIHFAGLKSVEDSIENPIEYWDFNVKSAINLLKVMELYQCRNFLFSSSATIYGKKNINSKFKESSRIKPVNSYGDTKEAIEKILYRISNTSNSKWKIAVLRYFNPIGAHPSGILGDSPTGNATNILPIINQVAAGHKKKLEIYGKDWQTIDGTGVRDYIHVMDIADGHIKALEYILNNSSNFLTLNLGTGKGISILELIKTFENVNNVLVPYEFIARRKGDVAFSVADNVLATSKLKWIPKRDLKKMCKDSWNWYLNNHDIYKKN